MRNETLATTPVSSAIRLMAASSAMDSTLNMRMPADRAWRISSGRLPTPE